MTFRNHMLSTVAFMMAPDTGSGTGETRDQEKPDAGTAAEIKATAGAIEARATAIGEKLAAVEGFAIELGAYADRKEQNAVSAIGLSIYIVGAVNPQDIMRAPEPGSEQSVTDKVTKVVTINNNPDKFTTIDPDTGRKTPSSYYKVAVLCTPAGKEALANLHWVRMALKNEPSPVVDGKAQPNPYAGLGEKKLEALRTTLTTRISNLRRAMIDGFKVAKQMVAIEAINEKERHVSVDIERDPENAEHVEPHNQAPIVVQDESKLPGAKRRHRMFSVQSFLALKPDKVTPEAIKAATVGGAWEVLVNSGARAPKGSGNKPGAAAAAPTAKYPRIETMDDFEDCAAEVAAFLDQSTDSGRKHMAALLALAADKNTGDDMIETLGHLSIAGDNYWHLIEDRFNNINAQKIAQRQNDKAKPVAA